MSRSELSRAYIVVKVVARLRYIAWSLTTIALLSERNLEVTVDKVVGPLRGVCLLESGPRGLDPCRFDREYARVVELAALVSRGGYSVDGECGCLGKHVCAACRRVTRQQRRFIVQDRYQGVYPYGEDHWFRGVTDGVGEVSSWQGSWLRCCLSR